MVFLFFIRKYVKVEKDLMNFLQNDVPKAKKAKEQVALVPEFTKLMYDAVIVNYCGEWVAIHLWENFDENVPHTVFLTQISSFVWKCVQFTIQIIKIHSLLLFRFSRNFLLMDKATRAALDNMLLLVKSYAKPTEQMEALKDFPNTIFYKINIEHGNGVAPY